ncbi:MAG: 50S ribosomal protein L31 [Firmicutes bacterium]|nr:50S ribosomal protein L31 [Bacillota bacterium]
MKPGTHPKVKKVTVACSCGNSFSNESACGKDEIKTEICNKCHPFYTGTQKVVDSGGRLARFEKIRQAKK